MSLNSITTEYNNHYRIKNLTPSWITLLTRNVNNRNISVQDWNIAMDDIRKLASDNVAVNKFIQAFANEFNDYYTRSIKSIEYTTDTSDKIDTPEDGWSSTPVEHVITFDTVVELRYIQLHLGGVGTPVDVCIKTSSDGEAYSSDSVIISAPVGDSDTRLIGFDEIRYVKKVKVYQYTDTKEPVEMQFDLEDIEFFKDNVTGSYVITRYDGTEFTIPMVDPATFTKQMTAYVTDAYNAKEKAVTSASNAEQAASNASKSEESAKNSAESIIGVEERVSQKEKDINNAIADSGVGDTTNAKNKLLRLDSNGLIPAQFIPAEKTIDMYEVHSVNDLTTLSKAELGDIAYILDTSTGEKIIKASYRLIGNNYAVRSNWVLQATTYTSNAAMAEHAITADDATRVNGTLIRFGSLSDYNSVDHEGLFVITDYAEES